MLGDDFVFFDNFKMLCDKKGISVSKAAEEIGFNKATVTWWKKEKLTPRSENLQKIANYFGVSTEYLLTGKEKTATITDDSLSAEFMALYSRLDENHQAAVLSLIESLLDSQ